MEEGLAAYQNDLTKLEEPKDTLLATQRNVYQRYMLFRFAMSLKGGCSVASRDRLRPISRYK